MSEKTQQEIAKGVKLTNKKLSSVQAIITTTKTVASAGTAEQLPDVECLWATIQAKTGNTNPVFLGDSSVDSTNGYELSALESIVVPVSNLSLLWLDVTTNGEGVNIMYGK